MTGKVLAAGSERVVVGLEPDDKRRRFAGLTSHRPQSFDLEDIISRLNKIRRNALAEMDSLNERFISQIKEHGEAQIQKADDAAEAVEYMNSVVGENKVLALNRASVIREIAPLLEKDGYNLISTYLAGYPKDENEEKVLHNYWQLPNMPPEVTWQSFTVQNMSLPDGHKDYTALLGVTAAAAEDGSVYFFQHTENIGTMLREARRLIIVVGIDKVVESADDAVFQTKCMGLFGLESVLLDLALPGPSREAETLADLPLEDFPQDTHIILLDNMRGEIAGASPFSELLTCISCRACAKHCPTHKHFGIGVGNYPRQYLWSMLVGTNDSLDLCTGCGMCYSECPLDINIPRLVSLVRSRESAGLPEQIKNRMLYDPWPFMSMASNLGPLSNLLADNKLTRIMLEKQVGYQREAWVPKLKYRTFSRWMREHKKKKAR